MVPLLRLSVVAILALAAGGCGDTATKRSSTAHPGAETRTVASQAEPVGKAPGRVEANTARVIINDPSFEHVARIAEPGSEVDIFAADGTVTWVVARRAVLLSADGSRVTLDVDPRAATALTQLEPDTKMRILLRAPDGDTETALRPAMPDG